MKIDVDTVNVLKNFSKINSSIVVQEGNVLKTISPTKTIMAKANVKTDFPKRFAIYELDRFLATLSTFTDPELDFKNRHVDVKDNRRVTNYLYADESTVIKAPENEISLPTVDVKFTLINDDLKTIEKSSGILNLPDIVITGDGKNIYIQAADTKVSSGTTDSIEIGLTDKTFRAIFKAENINKIIPGDYDVSISSKGISRFVGNGVEYYIAVEATSTF
jgi:hypothetical protein